MAPSGAGKRSSDAPVGGVITGGKMGRASRGRASRAATTTSRLPVVTGSGSSPETVAADLHSVRQLREQTRTRELELVALARRLGMTWTDIGKALGISPQAARALSVRNG